jgi:hypothetical protein
MSYCTQSLNTRNNERGLLRIPRKTRCPPISVDYNLSHNFLRLWAISSLFHTIGATNMLSEPLPTTLFDIRRKYLVSGGHDLRTLLDRVIVKDSSSGRIGATDPRDRVYALLGISNHDAAKEIIADYTLSCGRA